jgi:hypothetical protein
LLDEDLQEVQGEVFLRNYFLTLFESGGIREAIGARLGGSSDTDSGVSLDLDLQEVQGEGFFNAEEFDEKL